MQRFQHFALLKLLQLQKRSNLSNAQHSENNMPTEIRFKQLKRHLTVRWPLRLRHYNPGQRKKQSCFLFLLCKPTYEKPSKKTTRNKQVFIIITNIQSRHQSSRLRGAKRSSGGRANFEIKHKNRCFQKSKLFDWEARPPGSLLARLCQDPCFCPGWIGRGHGSRAPPLATPMSMCK